MTTWSFPQKQIVTHSSAITITAPTKKDDPPWFVQTPCDVEKDEANPNQNSPEEKLRLEERRIRERLVVDGHIRKILDQITKGNLINARRLAMLREWMYKTAPRSRIMKFWGAVDREQQRLMNCKPDGATSKYQLGGQIIACTAGMKMAMDLFYVAYTDLDAEFQKIQNHMAVIAEQHATNSEQEDFAREYHARCLQATMTRANREHAARDASNLETAKRAARHAQEKQAESVANRRKSAAERSGTKSIASPRPKRMPE